MSDTQTDPTALSDPREEQKISAGFAVAKGDAESSPWAIWTKVGKILGIGDKPLRRRALMQLSIEDIEGLAVVAYQAMPVAQAEANLIAVRADKEADATRIQAAQMAVYAALRPMLDFETLAMLRRVTS